MTIGTEQTPSGQDKPDDAGTPSNDGVSSPAPVEGADDTPGPDAGSARG